MFTGQSGEQVGRRRSPSRLARIVLGLSALVLTADAILLLVAAGPFIGEALLVVSIATYTAGALLLKPER